MNRAEIIGNLVSEPTSATTDSGLNKCFFRVAVNEKKDDKENTEYFDCTAWGKLALICPSYLHKGSKVYIDGKMKVKPYIGKDGKPYGNIQISIQNIEFLSRSEKKAEKSMDEMADIDPLEIPF